MIPFGPSAARGALMFGALAISAPRAVPQAELPRERYAEIYADACTELESGDPLHARERFQAALARSPENANCAYSLACCAQAAGDAHEAWRWLERAVDWGFVDAGLAAWDEDLDGLRAHPDFLRLLARMRHGLEQRLEEGPPLIVIWHGSSPWATQTVLSPDGDLALARDGVLWDLERGAVLALLFRDPARSASFAAFGPRGSFAATADRSQRVRLFDPRDGALLADLEGRAYPAYPLSFDAEGARLAMAGPAGRTQVFDLASKTPIASFETSGDAPAQLSPGGDRLLTLGTVRATLWRVDGSEDQELWSHEPDRRESWSGEFDEQGELCLVLARDEGSVTVLDALHGSVVAHIRAPEGRLSAACFRPRERAVATGDELGRVALWDAASGVSRASFQAHAGAVRWMFASRDGDLLLTSGEDGYVRAWDATGGDALWEVPERGGSVHAPSVSLDRGARRLILPAGEGSFELREADTGRALASFRYPVLRSVDAAVDAAGRRAAVLTAEGSLRLIDVESGATLRVFEGLGPEAARVALSPSGERVATSSFGGDLRLLDASDGRELARLRAYEGDAGIPELDFSPSGRFLLAHGRGARAGLVDADAGELVRWIEDQDFEVERAVWSRDLDRFAVLDSSQRVRVIEAESGAPVGAPLDHRAPVRCLEFAPGGEALLTGGDDGVARLFDVESGAVVRTLRSADGRARAWIHSLAISPDGALAVLAVGDQGTLVAFELASAAERWIRELPDVSPAELRLRFAPDGRSLYVADELDRGARVISAADGSTLAELGASVGQLLPSAAGRPLVALGSGSVRVLDPERGLLLHRRIELDRGEHLLLAGSGHCAGSPEAMGRVQILLDGESLPFDALAAELFDQKRVRASCAGVALAPPPALRAPRVRLSGAPGSDFARGASGAVRVEGVAEDAAGVLAVEVRHGSELVARAMPSAPGASRYMFALEFEPPAGAGVLELRAVGASGLESRAARLKLR